MTSNFIYRLVDSTLPKGQSQRVSIKPAVSYDMIPEFFNRHQMFYPLRQLIGLSAAKKNQIVAGSTNGGRTDKDDPSSPARNVSATTTAAKSNNRSGNFFNRKRAISEKDTRRSDVRILSKAHYIETKDLKSSRYANSESSTVIPLPQSAQDDVGPNEMNEASYNGSDNSIYRTRSSVGRGGAIVAAEKRDADDYTYRNSAKSSNNRGYQSTPIESNKSLVFPAKELKDLEDKAKFHLTSMKIQSPMTETLRMPGSQGSEPTVTVRIGRIEVHTLEPRMPTTKRSSSSSSLSLKDYLKQRSEGRLM